MSIFSLNFLFCGVLCRFILRHYSEMLQESRRNKGTEEMQTEEDKEEEVEEEGSTDAPVMIEERDSHQEEAIAEPLSAAGSESEARAGITRVLLCAECNAPLAKEEGVAGCTQCFLSIGAGSEPSVRVVTVWIFSLYSIRCVPSAWSGGDDWRVCQPSRCHSPNTHYP